jgi:rhodanese-related sulfurtransferase
VPTPPATIPQLSVTEVEAHHRGKKGGELVDVREAEEYEDVHAAGARHVALSWLREATPEQIKALELKEPLHVICRSGQRSQAAASILLGAGYRNVVNVSGGTLAWVNAGLPTE